MQRNWLLAIAVVMLGTTLVGCMDNNNNVSDRTIRNNSVRNDLNGSRMLNKRFANDQKNEKNRLNESRLNSNNVIGTHMNHRMEMSEEAAEQIASMKEIDKAYVMLTDNNAYVAVTLEDDRNTDARNRNRMSMRARRVEDRITDDLKRRIADEVRQVAPQAKDVYVSANPDFTGRMTSYMDDVRLGRPIQGFVAEFNELVDRIFPDRVRR